MLLYTLDHHIDKNLETYVKKMYLFKVIFVMILIDHLDIIQDKTKGANHENENTTVPFDDNTTETNHIMIEEPPENCSIVSNVTTKIVSKGDNIALNITWAEVTDDNRIATIRISPEPSNCEYFTDIVNHDLKDNVIIKPPLDHPSKNEILPDCTYKIKFESFEHDKLCTFSHTTPECIENKKCNCKKYAPKPNILEVIPDSEDNFIIKWDPGSKSPNNITYTIVDESFTYSRANATAGFESADTIKSGKNMSIINMKIFKGEKYVLYGTFINNFSCIGKVRFDFTVPRSNGNQILIFFIVTAMVVLVALKHQKFVKYLKKLKTILKRPRFDQTTSQHGEQPLIPLETERIPMTPNLQYTPSEFVNGGLDSYEFPRNKIIIKEEIGSGAFGKVYSAKALGIGGIDGYKMVAVKTLGGNITREAMNDFIGEIEIFKKIGVHTNIVTLLGCCTLETPYMMIMEFVPCGDLKNYLLELREQWLMKKNNRVFFPDNSDGAYIDPATPHSPVSTHSPVPTHSPVSITSSRLPSTSETVCTTLEDPMTPLLAHYHQALERVLDHTELQNFALQIAKGMAHLERIPITHRDLAARNILINEFKTLKISDFGLSRTGPYINHKTKKLPLRWMAIESIINQKYDSRSDVWSFGVVLWEIGTLGAFPYESVPDSFIQQFLKTGQRLERPEICTDEMYEVMKQCWEEDPDRRPTFNELVDTLDVKKRKVYVNFSQLNPTYVFPPSEVRGKFSSKSS